MIWITLWRTRINSFIQLHVTYVKVLQTMAAQSFPPPSSNLSYKVELSVSCSNLKDSDHFSKSDPAVFLYSRGREVEWTKVGRTEVIENNLNPKVFACAGSSAHLRKDG